MVEKQWREQELENERMRAHCRLNEALREKAELAAKVDAYESEIIGLKKSLQMDEKIFEMFEILISKIE